MDLNTVWDKNDLIMTGLAYTVLGMLVVFMILIIIMLCIKAMALFSGENKNKQTALADSTESKKAEAAPAPAAAAAVKTEDDSEIVAVITAAIAAMMGESATGFRIRSYRRVQDDEWNKAGRREVLDNRF